MAARWRGPFAQRHQLTGEAFEQPAPRHGRQIAELRFGGFQFPLGYCQHIFGLSAQVEADDRFFFLVDARFRQPIPPFTERPHQRERRKTAAQILTPVRQVVENLAGDVVVIDRFEQCRQAGFVARELGQAGHHEAGEPAFAAADPEQIGFLKRLLPGVIAQAPGLEQAGQGISRVIVAKAVPEGGGGGE